MKNLLEKIKRFLNDEEENNGKVKGLTLSNGKHIVIVSLVAVFALIVTLVLGVSQAYTVVNDSGYAVDASSELKSSLIKGNKTLTELQKVNADDLIYSNSIGYYVGEDKKKIDKEFPLITNDGTTIRFLDESNFLVSSDAEIYETFDGLYLSDGVTYNKDKVEVDLDEFILLSLKNGLYMNAQEAKFKNLLGTKTIKVNSIIYFSENAIRWYEEDNGYLVYSEDNNTYDATITIGDHTYYYTDLLKALSILKDAEDEIRDKTNPQGKIEEAYKILHGSEVKYSSNNGSGKNTGTDISEEGKGGTSIGGDAKGDSTGDQESGKENGGKGKGSSSTKHDEKTDTGKTGEGGGNPSKGDNEKGEGTGETGTGTGTGAGGGDSSEKEIGGTGGGETTGGGSQGLNKYVDPVVTISNIEPWSYAVFAKLNINDQSGAIVNGVKVYVYGSLNGSGGTRVNEDGYTEYEASTGMGGGYTGGTLLARLSSKGTDDMMLSPLVPDSTVYIQYQYKYDEISYEKTIVKGKEVIEKKRTRKTYKSPFIAVKTIEANAGDMSEAGVIVNWEDVFANDTNALTIIGLEVKNTQDYQADLEEYSIENEKKNLAKFVNKIEFTFNKTSGVKENIVGKISSSAIQQALNGNDISVVLPAGRTLDSDSEYTYTVKAYDKWNQEMAVLFGDSKETGIKLEEVEHTVYTKKVIPEAKLTVVSNKANELVLKIDITDTDNSIYVDDKGNIAYMNVLDYMGVGTELAGEIDGETLTVTEDGKVAFKNKSFGLDHVASYVVKITNLFSAQSYIFELNGTYDPQPSLKDDMVEGRLQKSELQFFSKTIYTAAMDDSILCIDGRKNVDVYGNERLGAHYAEIIYTITKESSQSALLGVETIRLSLSDNNKSPYDFELNKEDVNKLNSSKFDSEYNGFEVIPLTYTQAGVYLIYTEYGEIHKAEVGAKYWENIFPRYAEDGVTLNDPIFEILVVTPNLDSNGNSLDFLDNYTTYYLKSSAFISQSSAGSSRKYSIKTKLSLSRITTLRNPAIISWDDMYVGSGKIQFTGLMVYDEDGAVRNNGSVTISLSKGENALYTQKISTTKNIDDKGYDIEISDIKKGTTYILEIKADAYSEAVSGGLITSKTLYYNDEITGSGSLNASLTLGDLVIQLDDAATEKLSWENPGQSYDEFYLSYTKPAALTGEYIKDAILKSSDTYTESDKRTDIYKWTQEENDYVTTEKFILPEDARYIRFDYLCETDAYKYIYYYTESGELITQMNNSVDSGNTRILSYIPEDAKYVSFKLFNPVVDSENSLRYLEVNGLELEYYKDSIESDNTDYFEEEYFTKGIKYSTEGTEVSDEGYMSLKLPVVAGQIYLIDAKCSVSMYTNTMLYLGSTNTKVYNSPLEIPTNGGYLVINYPAGDNFDYHLWQVANSSSDPTQKKYQAQLKFNLEDSLEYVVTEGSGFVNMIVEVSETVENPEYEEDKKLSKVIEIDDSNLIDEYTYLSLIDLKNLPSSSSFRVTLTAEIKGETVTLTQLEFVTDASYILIHNNRELEFISYYPFGNFLVVEDFVHEINAGTTIDSGTRFYGIIDFQGHTITRKNDNSGSLIANNYGTIKNLSYKIKSEDKITSAVINMNYGTIDGFVLETEGDVTFAPHYAILTVTNYGTIRNFIFNLNGFTVISRENVNEMDTYPYGHPEIGIVCRDTYGTIEDGYIYSRSGYGIVFRAVEVDLEEDKFTGVPGVICHRLERGNVNNVFVVSDIWYSEYKENSFYKTNYGKALVAYVVSGDFKNSYWVGEEYIEYMEMHGGEASYIRSTSDTYSDDVTVNSISSGATVENVWHIYRTSEYDYKPTNSTIKQSYWAQLRDINWQEEILGEAFNGVGNKIADNIEKGYYPRLTLTEEMEAHQEYIKLPVTDISMEPMILSDSWANDTDHDNDSGLITISFYNPNRVQITSITIEGLGTFTTEGTEVDRGNSEFEIVDKIDGQAYENGVWKVTLNASVDEGEGDGYLSTYRISSFQYLNGKSAVVSEYKTSGFEFWKLIDHALGSSAKYTYGAWADIDEHKNWNYKIVKDIDFTGLTDTEIRIYESTDNASAGAFTGKIDGSDLDSDNNIYYHTLKNIDMSTGVDLPAVIVELGAGGVVRNLIVDNMQIRSTATPSIDYAGFIGYSECSSGAVSGEINNVHVIASNINAFGSVGFVVGQSNCSQILNCSAADYTYDGEADATALTMADSNNLVSSYYGGILGKGEETQIRNCYVRNINMTLSRGKNILSAGGICGRLEDVSSEISNCYTTGTISVTGENIGGIVGYVTEASYLHIDNCWSNMLLDVKGTHVGGVTGRLSYEVNNVIALGSIFVTDETYGHRITGTLPTSGELHRTYAYENQYVTGKVETDPDGAFKLITKEQLQKQSTWRDLVNIGDYFDVSCVKGVTRKYDGVESTYYLFPKLYSTDGKTYVWGQTGTGKELADGDISLPGVFGEHTIELDQALYTTPSGESDYMVTFKIYHPGITYSDYVDSTTKTVTPGFKTLIESGKVSISVPGLGLAKYKGNFTNVDIRQTGKVIDSNGKVVMTIATEDASIDDEQATLVTIHASSVYSYYSLYRLQVNYTDFNKSKITLLRDVQFLDEFGEPIEQWIEISNWYEWCYYIVGRDPNRDYRLVTEIDPDFESHGKSLEKVRITGKIDMSGMADVYSGKYGDIYSDFINLQFDILEGADQDCGFYGNGLVGEANKRFVYNTTETGDPWIEYIKTEIRQLTFSDILVNLYNKKQTTANSLSGLILKAQLVNNINIENIDIYTSYYTSNSVGFFGRVSSSIRNVKIENATLTRKDIEINNTDASYAGTLVGTVYDGIYYVDANNITVYAPCTIAGGLVGNASEENNIVFAQDNLGHSITNVKVYASSAFGVFGKLCLGATNFTVDGIDIEGTTLAAGFSPYLSYKLGKSHKVNNISVSNGKVLATTGRAGGIFGSFSEWVQFLYLNASNLEITGAGYTGGIIAYGSTANKISYFTVSNCKITSTGTNECGAGGVSGGSGFGYYRYGVIRDCEITSYKNAGGISGNNTARIGHSNLYIAEDVTITSLTDNAGGVTGYTSINYDNSIKYVACGATVIANGNNAGGIIGGYKGSSSYKYGITTIAQCYFTGTIKAADYAGGIIGFYDNAIYSGTTATFSNSNTAVNKCVFTGSIVCNGEHCDAAYVLSGTEDDIPTLEKYTTSWDGSIYQNDSSIYLWENATINGNIVRKDNTDADKVRFLSSKEFKSIAGVLGTSFLYSGHEVFEKYMPFVTLTGLLMPDIQWEYNGESVGILLPGIGNNPAVTSVYASDIDKINIETSAEKVYVKIEGITGSSASGELDTTDGVATINYDFNHDITIGTSIDQSGNIVNGKTYKAQDLRNTVMVDSDDWYMIDESQNSSSEIGGTLVNGYTNESDSLPAEFEQLSYIEGTGTQCIDTGYIPNANSKLKITYEITRMADDGEVIGLYGTKTYYKHLFTVTTGYANAGGTRSSNKSFLPSEGSIISETMKAGNLSGISLNSSYKNTDRSSLYLFGENGYEEREASLASMKLFEFSIYESDEEIKRFIPAKLISTGEVGLYEIYENRFYKSETEDNFIEGQVKTYEATLPSGYIQVDYIESDKTQYIKTGISTAEVDYKYVLDFQLSTLQDGWFFGTYTGNPVRVFGRYSGSFYKTSVATYSQTNLLGRTIATGTNMKYTWGDEIYLFACNKSSKPYGNSAIKLYSFRAYDSDETLVYDFVPCYSEADEQYGLYETINGKFYMSETGNPLVGYRDTMYNYKQAESNIYSDKELKVVHLWQGKALTADGEIYKLENNGTMVIASYVDTVICAATVISDQPIYEKTYNMTESPEGEGADYQEIISSYSKPTGQYVDSDKTLLKVEYIETKGDQYIDTGVTYAWDKSYEITYQQTKTGITSCIMGDKYISTTNRNKIFSCNTNNYVSVQHGSIEKSETSWTVDTTSKITQKVTPTTWTITKGNNTSSYDISKATTTETEENSVNNGTIYIGAAPAGTMTGQHNAEHKSYAKIYSAKIWDKDNTLIRDFIPVLNVETGVAGLYDLVEEKFYANIAYMDFDTNVSLDTQVYEGRYVKVDYIASDGTQYIDTGYKARNGYTTVSLKLNDSNLAAAGKKYTEYSYKGYQAFFGAYASNKKERFGMRMIVHSNGNQYILAEYKSNTASYTYNDYSTQTDGAYYTMFVDSYSSCFASASHLRRTKSTRAIYDRCTYNLYLFARNNAGTADCFAQIRVYGATISEWDDELGKNVVLHDYVPVFDTVDGVAGLYDVVTDTFYGNAGTGEFDYPSIGHINSKKIESLVSSDYDVTVEMYKNFSRVSGTVTVSGIPTTITEELDYRVYVTKDANKDDYYQYLVSPWEDSVYDSVIYKVISEDGKINKYIASLSENGTLAASFKLKGISNRNISEISNTFTVNDGNNYLVIKYNDGSAVVYDYVNEEPVYKQYKTFWSYASHIISTFTSSVTSLFSSKDTIPTSSGTSLESIGVYRIAKSVAITSYTNTLSGSAITLGEGVVTLNGEGTGTGITLASAIYSSGKLYDLDGKVITSDAELQQDNGTISLNDGTEYSESLLAGMIPKDVKEDVTNHIEGESYDTVKFLVSNVEKEAQTKYIKKNQKVGKVSSTSNVYDPVTGERSDVDTGALYDNTGSVSQLSEDYNPEEEPVKKSIFNVNYERKHLLLDENQEGFILIGVISVAIIAILISLGITISKRKKSKR